MSGTDRRSLRGLAWRWGPAIAWAALIFALSAQPGLKMSSDASVDAPVRHVAHIFVYAVLAVLLVHALGGLGRPLTWRTAGIVALLAIGYGITDELHQSFVPSRTPTVIDVVYDAMGTVFGLGVAWAWSRIQTRATRRPR